MARLVRALASCFYLGKLPAAGTWGSAVGALLAWSFPVEAFAIFAGVTVLGYACAFGAKSSFGVKDPGEFIMDEVSGMMLGLLWAPRDIIWYLAAFALFRLLDVRKPGFLRKLDQMEHPTSVMNDDVAAGMITAGMLAGAAMFF
jgi:phosphatidylglycerophosphatase A